MAEAKIHTREEDHFNWVISDIGLPNGTGVELMEWIRERVPQLPGIAMTAYERGRYAQLAKAAGFAIQLTKPIDFSDLILAITRFASPIQH